LLLFNFFISSLISIKKSESSFDVSFFSKNQIIRAAIKPKIEVKNAVFNQFNKVAILPSISAVLKDNKPNIIHIKVHKIPITVTRFLSLFVIATYRINSAAHIITAIFIVSNIFIFCY
jgi:hypothetical protein